MSDDEDFDIDEYHDIPEKRDSDGFNATERKLYNALIDSELEPEHLYMISRCEVDFAFLDEKVIIEVDGKYHDSTTQKKKDKKRDAFLNSQGWIVQRYEASDVYENADVVASEIKRLLNETANERQLYEHEKDVVYPTYLSDEENRRRDDYAGKYGTFPFYERPRETGFLSRVFSFIIQCFAVLITAIFTIMLILIIIACILIAIPVGLYVAIILIAKLSGF